MASHRIQPLDGLRALAIMPVMLHHSPAMHAYYGAPKYGWIGVDLFFVLSGYLITGILFRTKQDPGYYRNFYARRALRIWPLYLVFLVLVIFIVPAISHPRYWPVNFSPWVYFFFLQNLYLNVEYIPFLSPTWSLVVEEQFYLVWPLANSLLTGRSLARICVTGMIASPLIRACLLGLGGNGALNYGYTYSHMDGLLAGAWIALLPQESIASQKYKMFAWLATVGGTALFAWEAIRFSDVHESLFAFSGLAIGFGGLLVLTLQSAQNNSLLARVLSRQPLVYIGQISYCLYLVHELVQYSVAKIFDRRLPIEHVVSPMNFLSRLSLEFAACIALASLSWYFFESPILSLKHRFESKALTPDVATDVIAASAH